MLSCDWNEKALVRDEILYAAARTRRDPGRPNVGSGSRLQGGGAAHALEQGQGPPRFLAWAKSSSALALFSPNAWQQSFFA
jgi:hypothetical protein